MSVVQDGKATRLITITSAGVEIIAHGSHRRIRVQENYTSAAGATTDLAQQEPVGADDVIVLSGTPAIFTAHGPNGSFYPGQIVGLVKCSDVASVEGQQIEDDLI